MKNQHVDNDLVFALPLSLDFCPQYWQNFVNYIIDNSLSLDFVLKEQYNATMYRLFEEYIVEFKNKKDLAWFVLKWS